MAEKGKLSTQNPFLNRGSKKDSSSSFGSHLTSGLVSGHSSSLIGKSEVKSGLTSSGNVSTSKSGMSSLLSTGSSLLTSGLSNHLLSGSSLQSSALTSKTYLLSGSSNLLSSSYFSSLKTPSLGLGLTSSSALGTEKAPVIESSLTKLSLNTQSPKKSVQASDAARSPRTAATAKFSEYRTKSSPRKRGLDKPEKSEKKKKNESSSGEITAQVIKRHAIQPPNYFIKCEKEEEYMDIDIPKFIPPSKDMRLTQSIGKSLTDVVGIKRALINCVSGSLISQPNFTNREDLTRQQIKEHVQTVVFYDPEFILKVALYSRKELNIRTTSNFLLALAASDSSCRQFLKKYYCASIALPSDWIEVAEIFQTLEDNNLKLGALPAALRKAMITKFSEFDKYQLAKYNKASSGKKKKAKAKKIANSEQKMEKNKKAQFGKKRRLLDSDTSDSEDEEEKKVRRQLSSISYDETESEEVLRKQHFTIKQLIRKLHVKEPVEHVMCLIGKKYPSTLEDFYQARLPGTWEEERAGKRMKLPVPETWETQVSLKGNKAQTWEDLIDHKKLPFMAMLRNLRNLIKAGISPKHHNFVVRRLSDQRSVVNSKQFPFRFFSAYVVLSELEENYEKNQKEIIEQAEAAAMSAGVGAHSGASGSLMRGAARGGRDALRGVIRRLKQGRGRGTATVRGRGTTTVRGRGTTTDRGRGTTTDRGRGTTTVRGRGTTTVRGRGTTTVRGRGARGQGAARGRGRATDGADDQFPWWVLKKMKKGASGGEIQEVPYDKNLIQRYRKALDTAVKIATVHNVQPINGRTILLCDVDASLDRPCSSARGLGKPRTLKEIIILMGLMCKYSCEECEMIVFNRLGYRAVELNKGTILDNMDKVLNAELPLKGEDMDVSGLPYAVLLEKLRDRVEVDNLLVFGEDFTPNTPRGRAVCEWLKSYRHVVNPNLLFVSVAFSSPKAGFVSQIEPEHDNDIYISGYSDAILRFIAERGDAGQVNHVDKIDLAFQLRPMPKVKEENQSAAPVIHPEHGLRLTAPTPCWRTVRVFISSTFRDMHGERDLLTRFVFPELRSLGRKHFVNIFEVDLRWGVTEEETKDNRALDICLQEVSRCDLFIGLVGERYGWTPDTYQVPDTQDYDWVRHYPPGASVTELEMQLGTLSRANEVRDKAFFYLRDNSFENDLPKAFEKDFKSESEVHKTKVAVLRKKIRNSGLEVYDGYPCHWGGCADGKPMVAGLEEFGARVLNNLANAVMKLCPNQDAMLTEEEHINNLQWAFIENCSSEFVGRSTLIGQIISKIRSTNFGTIGVVGKPGCGKTAIMATTIMQYIKSKHSGGSYSVLVNIAGTAPGSNSLAATLRRLAQQINTRFGLGHNLPEDFKNLTVKLKDLLEEAGNVCTSRLVVFLDGTDLMDNTHQPFSLEWMPNPMPTNVVFVVSALEGEKTHKSLKRLGAEEVNLGGLDMWDKADIVRRTLAKHRKTLNESGFGNQMKLLMLKKEAHNPLFLKLACEELRVFGVFEKISDKLKSLPHTTAQILQEVLTRLEEDHGKDLVCAALSLLACARDGLYPEELFELLNCLKVVGENKFEPKDIVNLKLDTKQEIPPLTFSFLSRSIMSFLNPSSTWAPLLSLANREISTAVKLRYLKGADASLETVLHKLLAGFFLKLADPSKDNTWQSQNTRAFSELPYHLACAGSYKDLEEVLCNHKFIQAKCSLGLAAKLLDDFTPKEVINNKQQEKEQARVLTLATMQQYKSFVSRNIEIFVSFPSLEWQQAMNEPSNSIPYKDAMVIRQMDKTLPPYMEWSNKPETESQCYLSLSNFKAPANCVAMSPDSTKFATGSQDLLVRLYDLATGKELRFYSGHSDQVSDVCFVGNNLLCSASVDTTLCIWDVENGHRIHTLKGHSRRVNSCAADRRGKLVASGGWDCTVFVWKASEGRVLCQLDIGCPVNCVDFHPTEEQVVVGSWDSLIRIYNYFHKTRIAILRGHSTSVRDIAYSTDGRHLASAALDGDIKIWAAQKGSQVGNIRGHCGPVNKLTFSPTGKEIITAGDDHQIRVWSGDLGIPLHRIYTDALGAATSVCISPDGQTVAIGYHQGKVRIHDLNTGARLAEVNICASAVRAITFSKNGAYILAGCDDNIVQVLESHQGSRVCSLIGHNKPVLCIETSKNYIATGGEDFTCCLYEDLRQLKSSKNSGPAKVLTGHVAPVSACTFSADETMLATASRDATVRIYTLKDVFISVSPEPTHVLDACHADWINSCQWSNTGNFLVTASNDFNLKVWDMKTTTEKLTITGHSSAVNSVAYKYGCIVSGSSDGDVKVWSHKGIPITTLSGHTLRVNACDIFVKCKAKDSEEETDDQEPSWADMAAMEEDGMERKKPTVNHGDVNVQDVIVASAGDDGAVWIWRPLQANSLACLTGHSDRVLAIDMDRHNHIASCSLDCSVRLWQPRMKEEINMSKHDAPVTFVAVASNGSIAISGSRDGVIKIWKQDDKKLFQVKHSYQAHEKSVNCGCFDTQGLDKFVTGGDDNCVHTWDIMDRRDGFFVRKQHTYKSETPVACISYLASTSSIYFSTWDGRCFVASGKKVPESIFDGIGGFRSQSCTTALTVWPSAIAVHEDTREMVLGTTKSSFYHLQLSPGRMGATGAAEVVISTDDVDGNIPEIKRPSNWVNCVVQAQDFVFAGDSRGQIFISGRSMKTSLKIHKAALMSIEVIDDIVITASADCTIKIWTITFTNSVELSQIGQFFSPSPVMSLKKVSVSRSGAKTSAVTLLAGDQLGNIHHLCWQP